MPQYTVRDERTGKTVTFDWHDPNPPTDADMEEVFAAAQTESSAPAGGWLPTAGSFAGSLVGTLGGYPGRIAGAAVGGALGKGAEMLFDDKTQSFREGVSGMLKEGGKQGAFEAAGGALGKGIALAGKGLYKGGVALLPRALKQANPEIAETGLREGIALTKRGAAKADRLVTGSRQQADDMIGAAERSGAGPVSPRKVVSELRPVRDTLKKRADLGLPDETPALAARAKTIAAKGKGGIPLTRAQALKREAQDMATTAYKQQQKGAVIKDDVMMGNEAIARGFRKAIEEKVPEVAAVNARTQGLAGVREAAEHASGTGHILSRIGGAGTGLLAGSAGGMFPAAAGAGAGLALTTPGGLTATGLGLKRFGSGLELSPQAIRAALLARMLTEQVPEQ